MSIKKFPSPTQRHKQNEKSSWKSAHTRERMMWIEKTVYFCGESYVLQIAQWWKVSITDIEIKTNHFRLLNTFILSSRISNSDIKKNMQKVYFLHFSTKRLWKLKNELILILFNLSSIIKVKLFFPKQLTMIFFVSWMNKTNVRWIVIFIKWKMKMWKKSSKYKYLLK